MSDFKDKIVRADWAAYHPWHGRGILRRFSLVNDTFATTVAANGHATEEGWLDAGTIVTISVDSSALANTTPWNRGIGGKNHPSGVGVCVEGYAATEIIPHDTELEMIE